MLTPKQQRKVSYRSYDEAGAPVPFLAIQGKFLNQFGFSVGTNAQVKYGDGFVHISRIIQQRYGNPPEACTCVPVRR
ncbi:MAG: hypothetical protein WCX97_00210 [Candidatus Magasanikbacteria bacterium]